MNSNELTQAILDVLETSNTFSRSRMNQEQFFIIHRFSALIFSLCSHVLNFTYASNIEFDITSPSEGHGNFTFDLDASQAQMYIRLPENPEDSLETLRILVHYDRGFSEQSQYFIQTLSFSYEEMYSAFLTTSYDFSLYLSKVVHDVVFSNYFFSGFLDENLDEITSEYELHCRTLPIRNALNCIESLEIESYEGKPSVIAISLFPENGTGNLSLSDPEFLQSKKTRVLFSAPEHVLCFGADGVIRDLEVLDRCPTVLRNSGTFLTPIPFELLSLARHSRDNNTLTFSLSQNRETYVFLGGELIALRHKQEWKLFPLNTFMDEILEGVLLLCASDEDEDWLAFVVFLGALAMSLRNRRSGGLLVVVPDEDFVEAEFNIFKDSKSDLDNVYHQFLSGREIGDIDLSLVCNAASIDGACFFDLNRTFISFGNILNIGNFESESEGARTKAAEFASLHALAIKISEDGTISVYREGKKTFEML
jgi:hypothetical protein